MKCLIPTEPDDTQAIAVQLALEKMGHEVRSFFAADFPTRQKNSVMIDHQVYAWKSSDEFNQYSCNDYDVVWWRRGRRPYLPKGIVHVDDEDFVKGENSLFFESLTSNIAPTAWWINTKESARKTNYKLLQLRLAKDCGLFIPQTLCTNDPKDINAFLKQHRKGGVIYKPLRSTCWFEKDLAKLVYTSRFGEKDYLNSSLLQAVPGIYQVEIKKAYELRITCFGTYLVATKINSQAHFCGIVDWRAIPVRDVSFEPYSLPMTIQEKIRELMQKLGIVFGCFDFAVTKEGDYVFLEVNEQGQFLWLEECNSDFSLLDTFVQFLLNRSVNFVWDAKKKQHYLADYQKEVQSLYTQNMEKHIELNSIKARREYPKTALF